jgi:type I restriction enzyme, S subunit
MAEPLKLGDHCEKIGSGATPRGGKETYSADGPIALIRSQNVYNDRFSHGGLAFISEEQASQLQNVDVKDGDVLLNITGDSVARACQVDPDVLPARVNQHVAIIRPRPDRINPRFLRYYLVTPAMQAHMLGLAAAGATRNALTKSMIEGFRVPAWPVNQQTAIASVLGALDDKIELNRRMNETLEAMARAIFKDWFVDFGPIRAKMEGRAPYLAPEIWSLFPDRLDDEGKPEGWTLRPVGEFAELRGGKQLAKERIMTTGTIPVFGGAGIMGFTDENNADGFVISVGRVGAYCGQFFAHRGKAWIITLRSSGRLKAFLVSGCFNHCGMPTSKS